MIEVNYVVIGIVAVVFLCLIGKIQQLRAGNKNLEIDIIRYSGLVSKAEIERDGMRMQCEQFRMVNQTLTDVNAGQLSHIKNLLKVYSDREVIIHDLVKAKQDIIDEQKRELIRLKTDNNGK